MVHEELWLSHAEKTELLCVDCFECRIGRSLALNDLVPAFCNLELYRHGLFSEQELEAELSEGYLAIERQRLDNQTMGRRGK